MLILKIQGRFEFYTHTIWQCKNKRNVDSHFDKVTKKFLRKDWTNPTKKHQVSISSTFYARNFYVYFFQKNIYEKAAFKMMVKLTTSLLGGPVLLFVSSSYISTFCQSS